MLSFEDGEPCIVNEDCIEKESSCKSYVCTSTVATQTISSKNAAVQTTQSLESVSYSPVQIDKSSSFSNRRLRNYIKYNKLETSDATKFSSFDDESTQCKLNLQPFHCCRSFSANFAFSWRVMRIRT